MRTLGVSQSLTILVLAVILALCAVALLLFNTAEAAGCPPGWKSNPDAKNCLLESKTAIRCDGRCQTCFSFRGAKPGETGRPAGGCPECGPDFACVGCAIGLSCMDQEVKKRNIDPNLPGSGHYGRYGRHGQFFESCGQGMTLGKDGQCYPILH